MKAVEHRKIVYAFVEKTLGRELSKEEHEELKVMLTTMNGDAVRDLLASNGQMRPKLKAMGRALYMSLHKKDFKLEDIQFLKDALALTDEDVTPKEKKEKKDHD